jgi:hypothetical protein
MGARESTKSTKVTDSTTNAESRVLILEERIWVLLQKGQNLNRIIREKDKRIRQLEGPVHAEHTSRSPNCGSPEPPTSGRLFIRRPAIQHTL